MGHIFFSAANGSDPAHANDLFVSDGTAAGTHALAESSVGQITSLNGVALVSAIDADGNFVLDAFSEDGSQVTRLLSSSIDIPAYESLVGGKLYVRIPNEQGVYQLWATDGTAAGTTLVNTMGVTLDLEDVGVFASGGRLYIEGPAAVAGAGQSEVFALPANGSAPTKVVAATDPGQAGLALSAAPVPGGGFVFLRFVASTGTEIYVSNGQVGGAHLLANISPGAGGAFDYTDQELFAFNNKVLFVAENGDAAPQLFSTDGATAGTVALSDQAGLVINDNPSLNVAPGVDHLTGQPTVVLGRALVHTNDGYLLTDGTSAGSTRIVASDGSHALTLVAPPVARTDGTLLIAADYAIGSGATATTSAPALYSLDLATGQATLIGQPFAGSTGAVSSQTVAHVVSLGGAAALVATDGLYTYPDGHKDVNAQLVLSDGTATGTAVDPLASAPHPGVPNHLVVVGDPRVSGAGDTFAVAANETLDAGGGYDTAVFSSALAANAVSVAPDGTTTVSGPLGTETLVNTEALRFSDGAIVTGQVVAVQTQYQALIGRAAGTGELAFWTGAIQGGTATVDGLDRALAGTADGQAHVPELVNSFYELDVGRAASSGELNFWTGALQSGQVDLAGVQATFAGQANAGAQAALAVDQLYQTFFGRDPAAAETAYWTGVIGQGTTDLAQAERLFASFSGAAAAEAAAVTGGYDTIIGRDPSSGEVGYWSGVLAKGSSTTADFRAVLLSTADGQAHTGSVISGLYASDIGRPASADELNYWRGQVAHGTAYSQIDDLLQTISSAPNVHHVSPAASQAVTLAPGFGREVFDVFDPATNVVHLQGAAFAGFDPLAHAVQTTAGDGYADVLVTVDATDSLLFKHVALGALHASDFIVG